MAIQKWREALIRRFFYYFSFLEDPSDESRESRLADVMSVSKCIRKLVRSEVHKYFGVGRMEAESRPTPRNSMYSSTVIPKKFNRSLSTSKKKPVVKNPVSLNFHLFEIFLETIDFEPQKLSMKEVNGDCPKWDEEALRAGLRNTRRDPDLFVWLARLKLYVKERAASVKELRSKASEQCLVNSDLFSLHKTISIKRNSSTKSPALESQVGKINTEKRCYENQNVENLKGGPAPRPLKLNSPTKPNPESAQSVNSREVHVKDFEQRHLLKSNFSNELGEAARRGLPSIDQSGHLLQKRGDIKGAPGTRPFESMKNVLLRSYNSTQFGKLRSPGKAMPVPQKLNQFMCSARSLVSQESGVFSQFGMSLVPNEDLGESLGIAEHRRMNRKRAINRSQSKATQLSRLQKDPRDSSIGVGFTIASRELLSVDKSVSKSTNPFLLTSELQPTREKKAKNSSYKASNKKFRISHMEPQRSRAENKPTRHKQKHLVDLKFSSKTKTNKALQKGHQKFSSVNLDYLRLRTSKTDMNELKSEFSNAIEEEPRLQRKSKLKKKRKKIKDKEKKKSDKNLMVMKNLVARGSNVNYSKLLMSGLSKANSSVKKQAGYKKKLNFHTLQSNVNQGNYFHTNTFKSQNKPRPKKVTTRAKSKTIKTRRKPKHTSMLKKKVAKDKSTGNIPSLRVFPKQIRLKSDIKNVLLNKPKRPKQSSSKIGIDELRMSRAARPKKLKNAKKHVRNAPQKNSKFSMFMGKIKQGKLNSSSGPAQNQRVMRAKPDVFKSKRKSDVNEYRFDSNYNHKMNDKYMLPSGDPKKRKNRLKNKLGHFFSYLGQPTEPPSRPKKKSTRKLKNAILQLSRKA